MNYELAKKLKDAGFPFSDKLHHFCSQGCEQPSRNCGYCTMSTIYPTLSELIEECGSEIVLHSPGSYDVNENYFCPSKENWVAFKQCHKFCNKEKNCPITETTPSKFHKDGVFIFHGSINAKGKTPEEAVANLWLKLHE